MGILNETLKNIGGQDLKSIERAQMRLDSLTKPKGSLGVLEDIVLKLAGIKGFPLHDFKDKTLVIMAGDHGVVEEGVSAYPQEVTPQMILNFINGGAAVSVFARHVGARIVCVDVGVISDMDNPKIINKKIMRGTNNMAKGPAMTIEEANRALEVGIQMANKEVDKGADILATGEMGIGNTTPSSAILSVYSDESLERLVGKGTGLNDSGLSLKIQVIKKAIEVNNPNPEDPIDVLSKVGGLEIGSIAGLILGAASRKVPIVIDGFISTAGALIASKIEPKVANYIVASHASEEPGHKIMLELIGLEPMLHTRMRLGEGTGAVLAFNIVEASVKMINEMASFDEAGVSQKS
ncbi:MAG TPA: nicotinate-nucleotide--dimethylbenzimidazole phosphoribosyltransferase [Thermoanaerobacterales bacterium]|nr:nicotinate-nucleotide--dimethylbenzimidazole phosphoribosyltransferase [Thermoanaerobacterales bacterium]